MGNSSEKESAYHQWQQLDDAVNKYLEELRISSASIDQRRDMDRRKGFVAGWKQSEQITSAPLLEEISKMDLLIGKTYLPMIETQQQRISELEKERDELKQHVYDFYDGNELKLLESEIEALKKENERLKELIETLFIHAWSIDKSQQEKPLVELLIQFKTENGL